MLDFRESPAEPLTVSQITGRIISTLENGFASVCVVGEISGATRAASGHLYFSLVDANATLSAVIWKGTLGRLAFAPRNGEQVIAKGRISGYAKRGTYQLTVDSLKPVGEGAGRAQLLALIKKLESEGLLAAERKKPLPRYPQTIGIVTSAGGAAFADMKKILRKRFPPAKIILSPCLVQGASAPNDIVRALKLLDRHGICDVILLGRGGGSAEDLMAFNEEIVARAVADCETPVISSVGHEIDTTLCDLVADRRAATPSEAAEIAVPDAAQIELTLNRFAKNLRTLIDEHLREKSLTWARANENLRRVHPLNRLRADQQRVDDAAKNLRQALTQICTRSNQRLQIAETRIGALNPLAVLGRGFAVVRNSQGEILHSPKAAPSGELLQITLRDGDLRARAE